jgi:putative FmdB family regulatory protein
MPTYDYRCNACGHCFELFQSMSEKPKRKCPSCAKLALERLIGTGAAVLFKGSGFYETDYRSKSYRDAAKKDREGTASTGNSSAEGGSSAPKQAVKPAADKAEKKAAPAGS